MILGVERQHLAPGRGGGVGLAGLLQRQGAGVGVLERVGGGVLAAIVGRPVHRVGFRSGFALAGAVVGVAYPIMSSGPS